MTPGDELERAARGLRASLALTAEGSPARVAIERELARIEAELEGSSSRQGRVRGRHPGGRAACPGTGPERG